MKEKALVFLDKIFAVLKENQIELDHWKIDHLCYRTSSLDNYEEMKKVWSGFGELLVESDVNERDIATYKLTDPIIYGNYIIPLVEVPAPKEGRITPEGFEHIEVVIDVEFDVIMKRFSHIEFNLDSMEKELNPELVIKFGDCSIKFHHLSLEEVIEIEKRG